MSTENKDCGCEDGSCCPPKKKPRWTMYISILILLAALSVVALKVINHKTQSTEVCKPGQSGCCPSSDSTKCETTKGSSCSPKPTK